MKELIRFLLRRLGYKISRLPAAHQYHLYDYADIKFILADHTNPIILDIGANVGETIDRFRRLFPGARIVGVEANPSLWERLVDKYKGDPSTTVRNMAVCDRPGQVELFVNESPGMGMSSIHPWKSSSAHAHRTSGRVPVPADTLDRIARAEGVEHIDILKLDIQGAELAALRGAAELLAGERITLIFVEVWFSEIDYEDTPNFCEIYRLLKNAGFVLYGLYNTEQPAHTPNQPLIWSDAIFLHQSYLPRLQPLGTVEYQGRQTPLNEKWL
jgi:FkbM family methyltransferase